MTVLDPNLQAELLNLLAPEFVTEKDRHGWLYAALGPDCPVVRKIDCTGAVDDFVAGMLLKLDGFGEIEAGKPALCKALEYAREQVGVDRQKRIDTLIAKIESLSRTPDDPGQADGWAVPADFRFGNAAMDKAAERLGTPGGTRFGKLLCQRLREKRLAEPTAIDSALKLVEFVAGCTASGVQSLFSAISWAIGKTDARLPAEPAAIREAAVALYCLAASRAVELGRDLGGHAFKVKDYRTGIGKNAHGKALLVYGVIAAALEGTEGLALRLDYVEDDPDLPRVPHVFPVHVPAEGENMTNAFERAAYRSVVADNKEDLLEQCLDGSRDLGPYERAKLKTKLKNIREVEECCRALVVTGLLSPEPCREFVDRNQVPILIPDEQARDLFAGMSGYDLLAEIEEFWKAVDALSRAG